MRKLSAGDARERFAEIVNEAAYADKRTVITRHGKEVAAVVPISDLSTAPQPLPSVPAGAVVVRQSPEIFTFSVPCNTDISMSVTNKGKR
jgi:prevent-host-death family protein